MVTDANILDDRWSAFYLWRNTTITMEDNFTIILRQAYELFNSRNVINLFATWTEKWCWMGWSNTSTDLEMDWLPKWRLIKRSYFNFCSLVNFEHIVPFRYEVALIIFFKAAHVLLQLNAHEDRDAVLSVAFDYEMLWIGIPTIHLAFANHWNGFEPLPNLTADSNLTCNLYCQ